MEVEVLTDYANVIVHFAEGNWAANLAGLNAVSDCDFRNTFGGWSWAWE
jgi:hypothetical protein